MPTTDLKDMRISYEKDALYEKDCAANPFEQFKKWFHEALTADELEANAMALATADKQGIPSSRIVLLKEITEKGFVFYTNFDSKKGQDLAENPNACLLFWYRTNQRQIRIEGNVEKYDRNLAAAYFHSRPHDSQIGANVSPQSRVIESRQHLEDKFDDFSKAYENKEIPMPENWGGYILIPNIIEFWQGRMSRLHDRIRYVKSETGEWQTERVAP